jgi:hypothetical protein
MRFRRLYGASPWHLIGALASFAVIALAIQGWFREPVYDLRYILIWFAAAAVAHDLIFLPVYATLDRFASRLPGWVYLRVPTMLSGLLLLVFGAEIFRRGNATFFAASGSHQNVYLGRYLVIVAVMFALSGAVFLISKLRS